jgi:hypothetical protein
MDVDLDPTGRIVAMESFGSGRPAPRFISSSEGACSGTVLCFVIRLGDFIP